jgi:hypothetical protein
LGYPIQGGAISSISTSMESPPRSKSGPRRRMDEIAAYSTDLGSAEGGGRSEHWSSQRVGEMGSRGGDVWYACRSRMRQSQAPCDGEARRCSSFLIFGSDRLSDSPLHARALSHN